MSLETILLTRHDEKTWTAVCPEYPEHSAHGSTSAEAIRRYNIMLWQKHHEKAARLNKCHQLMDDEIYRAGGIPEWALKFPSWLLWNKMEREHHRNRMNKIVIRICAAENTKDLSYEELTDLCIAEFHLPDLDAKPMDLAES